MRISGWHHTAETKGKMSVSQKRRLSNPIARIRLSQVHKGKTVSEETKAKLRKARAGQLMKPLSIETKNKISRTRNGKGYPMSLDCRLKISASLKGRIISEQTRIRLGKAGSGHLVSAETRERLSESLRGSRGPNWMGGKSFEPYAVEFNNNLKKYIRDRDGHICQQCGVPQSECIRKLDVHHIDYDKKNCLPNNLISLCSLCNNKANRNRQHWTLLFKQTFENRGVK